MDQDDSMEMDDDFWFFYMSLPFVFDTFPDILSSALIR